jgi:uncharacterized protein (DUF305 family)
MASDIPFDAAFLDSMVVHHEGAVAMANDLLQNSERPELVELAEAIIATQATEIEQMQEWRAAWFPDLQAGEGMEMEMGVMEVDSDTSIPYDQRFIDAMIDHHEGAIAMAEAALEQSERSEVRSLAEAIVRTQQAEIDQMRAWAAEWYPE